MKQNVQQITQETKSKVVGALDAFYDMQLTLQKNVLDGAMTTFESGFALQRKGLDVFQTAVGATLARVQSFDRETFKVSVKDAMSALPAVTPEAAERISEEMTNVFVQVHERTVNTSQAVRAAADKGAERYQELLGNFENRSKEGLISVASNAENATLLASRVTGKWVHVMFQAVENALDASVEVAEDVAASTEAAVEVVTEPTTKVADVNGAAKPKTAKKSAKKAATKTVTPAPKKDASDSDASVA